MAENELVININGDPSNFNKALKGVSGNLKKIAAVSGAAFVGFSAVIVKTVADFAKFDDQLRGVKTLLDESSFASGDLEGEFAKLTEGLKNVGGEIPVSIDQLSKSLFDTVSAGIDASKSIGFVESAARLAVAGQADLTVATDGLTSATNAFGLGAENAELTAAKLFTAQKFGTTTIAELSSSLGVVAASANASGVSFEELLAGVSAATGGAIKTNQAFTSLKAVFANVVKPTQDAVDEAKRLGIEFNSTALRTQGLAGFLNTLTQAEGFNATSAERLFGSVEALNVIQAITAEGSKKFTKILGQLGDETKLAATFQGAFETQSASLSNQFKLLQNNLSLISTGIGEIFGPAVVKASGLLLGFIQSLRKNEAAVKSIAIALGVATGGAGLVFALASVGLVVPKVVAGLSILRTALGLTTISIRTLVGATGIGLLLVAIGVFLKFRDEITNAATGPIFAALQFISSTVEALVGKFLGGFKAIGFAITGNLTEAVAQAKLALIPLPIILFNAAKEAGDAFNEGRALGREAEELANQEDLVKQQAFADQSVQIEVNKAAQTNEVLSIDGEQKALLEQSIRLLRLAEMEKLPTDAVGLEQLRIQNTLVALLQAEAGFTAAEAKIAASRLAVLENFASDSGQTEAERSVQLLGIAIDRKDELVTVEIEYVDEILSLDRILGDSQVSEFNSTTSELIAAAQARSAQIAAASGGGGGGTTQAAGGGTSGGTGGEGSTAADAVFGLLLEDSAAGRAARKNLTPFSFNPLTNQNDLLSFIQQILIDRGIQFQRGFSGEGFTANFSGREIVIPENFAEGIRRGRFALVGGGQERRMLGEATRENVRVDISFRGREATRVLQAQTNQDTRLGTRREIT